MRASLLVTLAAAQFDYQKFEKQYGGNHSQSHGSSGDMDWHKYAGANANWSKYAGAAGDWKKYWNGSKSEMGGENETGNTYKGPFHSDPSILKLKGNLTALKAKEKEVEHAEEQVKKFVPAAYQAAPLGQYKKDLSDIHDMIKEAEKEKKEEAEEKKKEEEEAKKNETKGEPSANKTSTDDTVAKVTAFLARTDLVTASGKKVDAIQDQIRAVEKREDEIKKYVPSEYQPQALNSTKGELAVLKAKLKSAKAEEVAEQAAKEAKAVKAEETKKEQAMEAKEEKEKEAKEAQEAKEKKEAKEEKRSNATSSEEHHKNSSKTDSADLTEADAGAALLASERSTTLSWGGVSVCFCATVSVLSLYVALHRRQVNIDQRPLLG